MSEGRRGNPTSSMNTLTAKQRRQMRARNGDFAEIRKLRRQQAQYGWTHERHKAILDIQKRLNLRKGDV